MLKRLRTPLLRPLVVSLLCLSMASCEPPRVYGSIGYSSYSGGYYGSGFGGSVSIGGRIL